MPRGIKIKDLEQEIGRTLDEPGSPWHRLEWMPLKMANQFLREAGLPQKLAINQPKENVTPKTVKVPKDLDERLKQHCKQVHTSHNDLIVAAIVEYLDRRKDHKSPHEEIDEWLERESWE